VVEAQIVIVTGPDKGLTTVTNGKGQFSFSAMNAGNVDVEVSRAGYITQRIQCQAFVPAPWNGVCRLELGRLPLELHGRVSETNAHYSAVAGVRVEILTGPNAGKVTVTDAVGLYAFRDLVGSPGMQVRFSKAGLPTCTILVPKSGQLVRSTGTDLYIQHGALGDCLA
jgi:hypothetical protein